MAQAIPCDICGEEQAIQLLTSMTDGQTIAMGPACLPVFYGQSLLLVLEAGEHKGPASKCQACRRTHEHLTTPVTKLGTHPADPDETEQAPDGAAGTASSS